ncbi:CvpA family protein [Fictibacillus sp. Mic-4]|uniref:CvpA family protein n=1 Tax=Fictibacillus TaxID=1329200 RepID=UPI0003FE83CA|nr:CvpA family protein [Fictibacillus gelatini]
MLSLIIIVLLIIGFFVGLKRGLIMQVFHLTSFIIAFFIAYHFYDNIAPQIKLLVPYPSVSSDSSMALILKSVETEKMYYNAISFAILFFGTKIILRIVASMLTFLADLPILRTVNRWLGGLLGFVEVYLVLFILLSIASLIQTGQVQHYYESSSVAQAMVNHTPYFSDTVKELWSNHSG